MSKPTQNKPSQTGCLSKPWTAFAHKLATALAKLEQDEFLCLSVKGSEKYVQFSLEWVFGMRVDTTSNICLPEKERLNEQQIASLIAAGWCAPTWSPDEPMPDLPLTDVLLPDNDKDLCPNYFVDLNLPVAFDTVADLAVHTFANILRVASPKQLEYYAYDDNDEPIEFPELGLKFGEQEEGGGDLELTQLLLKTIRETIGVSDIEYDEDGHIGIRYRSALSFIKLNYDGLFVSFFSQLLTDVRESSAVYKRLSDINGNEIMLRVFFKEDVIYAAADIPSLPFVGTHVAEAFGYFCDAADRLGIQLKAEFGGETTFEDNAQSTMLH